MGLRSQVTAKGPQKTLWNRMILLANKDAGVRREKTRGWRNLFVMHMIAPLCQDC